LRLLYVILGLMLMSTCSVGQSIPENSHRNLNGIGWSCDRGYYRVGDRCVKVIVPENAKLNYFGNGWECNRGYCRVGDRCVKVIIPENAKLNYFGNGWECNKGHYRVGDRCVKVIVPENAKLNYFGNGWECNRGYYRVGNGCVKVIVPENAKLNFLGNDWECESGFKKSGDSCVAMTPEEIRKQEEVEKAMLIAMEISRLQGVSGDDCETEYKTGAEVCVEIMGVNIECNKSYIGEYYRDCDVTLDYEIRTDYKGGSYIEAVIEFIVEIEYMGRNTYFTQSDIVYENQSHDLYAYDSESGTMYINFSFSSYQEIIKVEINSTECEIESVDLY